MKHGLSDADKERFESIREKLEGVERADPTPVRRPIELGPIDPMLAETYEGELSAIDESEWFAEKKYDGTRIMFEKLNREIRAYTRRGIERSATIPGIIEEAQDTVPDGVILDCEFAFVDQDNRTQFFPIHADSAKIEERELDRVLFVFDILVKDKEWVIDTPLRERKKLLQDTVDDGDVLKRVPFQESGFEAFYTDVLADEGEGIMIKRRASHYYINTRSAHWRKVKAFTETDAIAVGFTPGEGQRSDTFGALVMTDGTQYIGRVGSGFSEDDLKTLRASFVESPDKPVPESKVGMPYTPIEPFVIRVKYQNVTENEELRAPVFLRTRDDKPIEDVTPI